MEIPFEPTLFGLSVNIHLVLEYLAFSLGFWYYIWLRKQNEDAISSNNRLSIITGAVFGALLGSRIMGFLENPLLSYGVSFWQLFNLKTIMGGLFGGLLGVEVIKKIIGEKNSSGDLFTYPIILGIIIGRIGCFLSGTKEFTYGRETKSFLGMDLGDGSLRHPIALYEIIFLILLWMGLRWFSMKRPDSGALFRWFMITYFFFRFLIEFLKPNTFYLFGLSSIQYLCIFCLLYYRRTLLKAIYAH